MNLREKIKMCRWIVLFQCFLLPVTIFFIAVLGRPTQAIGIGVSPPALELEEGMGRLILFNPGDQPVLFRIDLEGRMTARPSEGTIGPKRSTSSIVTGEGEGVARVLMESVMGSSGIALPAIEVPIKELYWEAEEDSSILIPAIIGASLATLIAVTTLVLLMVKNKKKTSHDIIRPEKSEPISLNEVSLNSN